MSVDHLNATLFDLNDHESAKVANPRFLRGVTSTGQPGVLLNVKKPFVRV